MDLLKRLYLGLTPEEKSILTDACKNMYCSAGAGTYRGRRGLKHEDHNGGRL